MAELAPWLEPTLAEAMASFAQQRLGHALLVHGPAGWGEVKLANALALALLNGAAGPDERDAAVLAHPDLRWLAPEAPGGQIKIDEIRELTEFAVQTPQLSDRKVVVVAGAERMNAHAANALLKTLEEPPGACHLILTTTALAELLPTIRSRCQLLAIRPPTDVAVARAWLGHQALDCDASTLDGLAFEYGHAVIAVTEALEREERPLADELTGVAEGVTNPLAVAEKWAKLDLDALLARWMRYVHAGACGIGAFAGPTSSQWRDCFEQLIEARAQVRSPSNPNARLLLERLLLAWREMFAPTL